MRTQRHRLSVSDFRYTPLVAALGAAFAAAPMLASATTVTANDPRDSSNFAYGGSTTLRGAIEFFNGQDPVTFVSNCTGNDTINVDFDYPTFMPNGPFVSQLSSPLPTLQCDGLTINGVAGTHGKPAIAGDSSMFEGLWALTNTPVTVKGLDVSGFTKVPDPIDGGPFGIALRGNMDVTGNDVHGNSWGIHTDFGRTVSGNAVFANTTGIYVEYGGVSIQGNDVHDNTENGIIFDHTGTPGGSATGNFIGTNGGNGTGMYVEGSAVSISGNTFGGNNTALYFEGDPGSVVVANYIGTDSAGNPIASNGTGIGFGFSFGTQHTRIRGNTIAGNVNNGIDLANFDDVEISGNFVGTNSSGALGLGNGSGGIITACGTGLVVRDNVIGGNGNGFLNSGIELRAVQSGGVANVTTTISGNKVGLKGDGVTPLGANSYGILLMSGFCNDVSTPAGKIVVTDNRIGGNANDGITVFDANDIKISDDIAPNVIFNNAGYGVNLQSGNNVQITGNLIHHNAASETFRKNINLAMDGGILANDPGDTDTGPNNNGQNFPKIDSVVPDVPGNRVVVSFTLDTLPGSYRVDLYANTSATTVPGGDTLVATRTITVPAGGVSDTFVVPGLNTDYFSMLATSTPAGVSGETSEFSDVVGFTPAAALSVSPASLDFGSVSAGNNSASQTVTVMSAGTLPYRIDSVSDSTCYGGAICSSGAFTCVSTCTPGNYAPNSTCQITATFHPPAVGTFTSTIAICGSGTPFQTNLTLTGSGATPPPITISPASFDFGAALLGTHTAATTFIVFNPSGSAVSVGALNVSPGFSLDSTTCGATIAAQDRCTANVSFAPTRAGTITGAFTVSVNPAPAPAVRIAAVTSSGTNATAALSGTGVVQAIIDAPSALEFGDFTAGTPAIRRTVTIRNTGNAILTLSSVTVSGPFTLGNGCPENLAPGESCTLTLDFAQAALGPYSGSLVIVSNAVGGSRTIALSARTVATAAPRIRVSPATIGFGDRMLGTSSAAQRVTITNEGNDTAVLSAPATTSLDFLVVGTTCGASLAPAQTCFADVALRPAGFGPRTGSLLIGSNAVGSPNRVDLNGTGCRPFSVTTGRLGTAFNCKP